MNIGKGQYKSNVLYPRIVAATTKCLELHAYVAPVDLFVNLGYLSKEDYAKWRSGKINYLEKAIKCNLSKSGTILRILRYHGHDLNLHPSITTYKHKSMQLRFSKTGEPNIEKAYSTHLLKVGLTHKSTTPFGQNNECNEGLNQKTQIHQEAHAQDDHATT